MKTYRIPLLYSLIILSLASAFPLSADYDYGGDNRDLRQMVIDVFDEVLDREPTRREIRRYSELAEQNDYDYRALAWEIREDYDSNSRSLRRDSRRNYRDQDVFKSRRWVEAIFEDAVGRLPDEYEMLEYCDLCLDEDMSKRELERMIRDDYVGVWEGYGNNRDRHYNFRRYTDDREVEMIIEEAYRDFLGRSPDTQGLRNYRRLMIDEGWSESRVRENIKNSYEACYERNSRIITRAYEDLLDRQPSNRERDEYAEEMYRRKWDEGDLRNAIRKSQEYQYTRPRGIIEEAYEDVLLRAPDASSYEGLRKEIVKHGWDLDRVKKHLRKSDEYRNITIPKLVKQAYQEVLGRDPDPQGMRSYSEALRKGWSYERLTRELRKSEEYRSKHR